MKTKFITSVFLILALVACTQDDEVQIENVKKQSIFDQVNNLSEGYNVTLGKAADTDWKKVAIADVAAGLGEAADPNSTVLSVTLVAAAASVKEYNNQQSNISGGGSSGTTSRQIVSNEINPYDSYGYWHYASIDNVLVEPERYLSEEVYDNERFYVSTKEFLLENGVEDYSDGLTIDQANVKLKLNSDILEKYGFLGDLKHRYDRGDISQSVYEIMHPYYDIFSRTSNIEEFVEYSLQAEELIVNSELENKDKGVILSTMATARYGMQYWSKELGSLE